MVSDGSAAWLQVRWPMPRTQGSASCVIIPGAMSSTMSATQSGSDPHGAWPRTQGSASSLHEGSTASPGALPPTERSGDLSPPQASELDPMRHWCLATDPRVRVQSSMSASGSPLCSGDWSVAWPPSCPPALPPASWSQARMSGDRSSQQPERLNRHVMGCGDGGMMSWPWPRTQGPRPGSCHHASIVLA